MTYTVKKHEHSSSVWCGGDLVDEIGGPNHHARAKRKARLLEEWDDPSSEKRRLHARLVELTNRSYGCQVVGDNLYMNWSVEDIKKQIARLEEVFSKEPAPQGT